MTFDEAITEARRLKALRDARMANRPWWRVVIDAVSDGLDPWEQLAPTADELRLFAAYRQHRDEWDRGRPMSAWIGNVELSCYMGGSEEENRRMHVSQVIRRLCAAGDHRDDPRPWYERRIEEAT